MSRFVPDAYSDAAAEYAAVRRAVGLVNRGDLGVVEVTGRDRASFLHAMLSNDIKSVGPGQGTRAAFLDQHGKVQVLLLVWALDDRILLITPGGLAAKAVEALDRYLFSEKAVLRDAFGEHAAVMLAGPGALAMGERLCGAQPPPAPWASAPGRLGDADVRMVRGGSETGESEVWILAPAAEGERLWEAAVAAGAAPIGRSAWESLRIEAGWPAYGTDVDATVLLPEIPIEPWVSYTKGCYIGQEVVVRIRDRGHVNRHLRGLVVDSDTVPAPGSAVLAEGGEVGRVTSATFSYGLGRPIALAFVRRSHAEPGTRLEVRGGELALPVTVSALPFG